MSKIKKSMISMRNAIKLLLLVAISMSASSYLSSPSDKAIKNQVVKLTSHRGSCSGEQIKAPSGVEYILTAAHCRILEENGQIHAITEDGRELDRRVIAEDPNADLLLLEGIPGLQGMDIAKHSESGEDIRTFTHGKGQPTYRTNGVIIYDRVIDVLISEAPTPEDKEKCISQPKYIVEDNLCIMHTLGTVTTAMVVPGSSGGPAVNGSGELIGVVSAGNDNFSILVPLDAIQDFTHSY